MNKAALVFTAMILCLYGDLTKSSIHDRLVWSSPTTLSSAGVNASSPCIAMDANANIIAAWIESGVVWAACQPAGGAWSSASAVSGSDASSLSLVIDSSGTSTALWLEGDVVKSASKTISGSWGSASSLSSSNAASPQIAIDASDNIVAVWVRSANIESSTQLAGGSWQMTPDVIASTNAAAPYVAIGSNGTVATVWYGLDSSINTVYAATKTLSGGTWSAAQTISTPMLNSAYPRIIIDEDGTALAFWFQYNVSDSVITAVTLQTASQPSEGSWSSPINLANAGIRLPLDLSVACDSANDVLVAWTSSMNGSLFALSTISKAAAADWATLTTQDIVLQNYYPSGLDISVVSNGTCWLTYMYYNWINDIMQIQSTCSDLSALFNNNWRQAVTISTGTRNATPRISCTKISNALYGSAAWVNYDGMNTQVQAASGTGSVVLPPTNVAVTQACSNLGVFTELQNTLSWTASASPNIILYLVYRDGLNIAQISPDTTQFIDRNRVHGESVIYGVAAVDQQYGQSTMATASL